MPPPLKPTLGIVSDTEGSPAVSTASRDGRETSSSFNSTNPSTKPAVVGPQAPLDFGIVVATRIRPFNKKELAEHAAQLKAEGKDPSEVAVPCMDVETDQKTLILLDAKDLSSKASFTFDYIFTPFAPTVEIGAAKRRLSSLPPGAESSPLMLSVATPVAPDSDSDDESEEVLAERAQAEVYGALGAPIVKSAWEGYNACIFAYGQTSSGKTYTMMGTKRDPGVIPRLCKDLFERIEEDEQRQKAGPSAAAQGTTVDGEKCTPVTPQLPQRRMVKVTVSYMEIYNEQVRDLLKPRPKGVKPKFSLAAGDPLDEYQSLKVRQHPLHGPFVEGLITVDVDNWLECVKIIRQGNEVRSHCTTAMNESSSRSHAIFQMILTQTEALGARVRGKDVTNHKVSKINLVDLAGSERILRTNVTGKHLTEAQSINQSLSTLRRVIDALVQKKKGGASAAASVVPYRESMLTWILSDNFGGNSKTVMCANVSPHSSNASESESTLRYATLARGIINRIRVNEDPSAKLIRELQSQLKVLQEEMLRGPQQFRVEELMDEIAENRRAMEELSVKEEGMKRLINESRAREEKLLNDVQSHQMGEEKWRREAEKLRKEKEELRQALKDIAKSNPDLVARKEGSFWNITLDDSVEPDLGADDSTVCPPMSRRKSSMRFRRQPSYMVEKSALEVGPNSSKKASSASSTTFGPSVNTSSTVEKPEAESPAPRRTGTMSPQSTPNIADAPRFGRRAATEEAKERPKDSRENERPMSEQYLQSLNTRLASGQMPQRTSVGSIPLSLQHLANLVPVATTTANVFGAPSDSSLLDLTSPTASTPSQSPALKPSPKVGAAKSKQPPDSLDTFLEGGGVAGPTKAPRGVPPWRKQSKK